MNTIRGLSTTLGKGKTYSCQFCDKPYKSSNKHSKYCSLTCFHKANTRIYKKSSEPLSNHICFFCNKPFKRKKSWTKDRTRVFCSKDCWYAWLKTPEGRSTTFKEKLCS